MKKLNKKGFTLIELLAVIVIMAILVAVAIPAVTRYLETSRKDTYVSNVQGAISAVRNETIFGNSSVSKTYYVSKAQGCYEFNGSVMTPYKVKTGVNEDGTDKMTQVKDKTACLDTTTGYVGPKYETNENGTSVLVQSPNRLWSDGSVNELLEKKLNTSPYGNKYLDYSNIVVTYSKGTYSITANILDESLMGIQKTKAEDIASSKVTQLADNTKVFLPINN